MDIYSTTLFILTALVNVILIPTILLFFSNEYFETWQPVPFLMLGTVFSALSGFLAVSYTAAKNTTGALKTVLWGGIISIFLNYILIPKYGIVGAGLSSTISYFILFIIRYKDTQKLIKEVKGKLCFKFQEYGNPNYIKSNQYKGEYKI